jgi:hypothetical protein
VAAIGVSPFSSRTYPSMAMILYAALYLSVILALAVRQFNRRDL